VATNPAQSRYLADSVSTATPAQLVVMLYDRLGLDLRRAAQAIAEEPAGAATPHLLHAQQIVAELLASLQVGNWDGADNLGGVYGFLIRELVAVNMVPDLARLAKCAEIITGLAGAWREAANQLSVDAAGRGSASVPGAWVA
jgi:flagellar protein FliS